MKPKCSPVHYNVINDFGDYTINRLFDERGSEH
jgi:hypothetical protein